MKLASALTASLVLFSAVAHAARADQFDCIFKWDTVIDARADVKMLAHSILDDQGVRQFVQDHVISNIKVWRASQDTVDISGDTLHNYLPGFFALISVDHRIPVLENDPALQVCVNRDKMNAGQTPYLFLSSYSAAILKDIRFAPIYMGANFPFGSLQ
jgi:hypothetical protein